MSAPRTPRRRLRRWFGAALLGMALWWLAGFCSAWIATKAHPSTVAPQAQLCGRPIEVVSTRTADGVHVCAWLVRASEQSRACVVLAPGVRGNRIAMVPRAEWYLARGWSTLLVDLRGTGQSDPERISFGWGESRDLGAWRALLLGRGFTAIGAHGNSLGAAAIAYSDGDFAFAVLESCYADVEEALDARLPWVPLPHVLLWPLRVCASWLIGVDSTELRPVDAVARLRCPTALLCGDADTKVGPDALDRLFAACGAADKHRTVIPGLGHVDLFAQARVAWEAACAEVVPDRKQ